MKLIIVPIKSVAIFLLYILCISNSGAQEAPIPFCRFSIDDGWSNNPPMEYLQSQNEYIVKKAKQADNSGVPEVIAKIKQSLSINVPIDIYIAKDEDNAFATVIGGRKVIVVDVGFLIKINKISNSDWGAIQVLAHEVGHHIAGFDSDRHRGELNADYWSGQILQRLGASRAASTKAILAFGTNNDTISHPSKIKRSKVIKKGWDDASKKDIDYSYCQSCQ
jgi:hypothetical protein